MTATQTFWALCATSFVILVAGAVVIALVHRRVSPRPTAASAADPAELPVVRAGPAGALDDLSDRERAMMVEVLSTQRRLADTLKKLRQPELAEAEYHLVLASQKRLLGSGHPHTVATRFALHDLLSNWSAYSVVGVEQSPSAGADRKVAPAVDSVGQGRGPETTLRDRKLEVLPSSDAPVGQGLARDIVKRYRAGETIRMIAAQTGHTYSFVRRVLTESGVQLRQRGGARRRKKA